MPNVPAARTFVSMVLVLGVLVALGGCNGTSASRRGEAVPIFANHAKVKAGERANVGFTYEVDADVASGEGSFSIWARPNGVIDLEASEATWNLARDPLVGVFGTRKQHLGTAQLAIREDAEIRARTYYRIAGPDASSAGRLEVADTGVVSRGEAVPIFAASESGGIGGVIAVPFDYQVIGGGSSGTFSIVVRDPTVISVAGSTASYNTGTDTHLGGGKYRGIAKIRILSTAQSGSSDDYTLCNAFGVCSTEGTITAGVQP